jgi:predicted RND superfamily exporter protein
MKMLGSYLLFLTIFFRRHGQQSWEIYPNDQHNRLLKEEENTMTQETTNSTSEEKKIEKPEYNPKIRVIRAKYDYKLDVPAGQIWLHEMMMQQIDELKGINGKLTFIVLIIILGIVIALFRGCTGI